MGNTITKTSMQNQKQYTAVIVPHTHWDREWYSPFQIFRIRLVKLTDLVIKILQTTPAYKKFTFDGQTIVLEDYLEIKPTKRDEITELVKTGRLLIGPWYVLPDEFLISGESMIRNLMIGHKISEQMGGTMKIGYIPDPFGHISQLPQIFHGFDIDTAVFTRGIGADTETHKTEFIWKAKDGCYVLALHQIKGYGNFAPLPHNNKNSIVDFTKFKIKELLPLQTTNIILLNNGTDHLLPTPELPKYVEILNREIENTHFFIGAIDDYVNLLRNENPKLSSYTGELRGGKFHNILSGVFSARIYIKQENVKTQTLLEKIVEPLTTIAFVRNNIINNVVRDFSPVDEKKEYPQDFINLSWKKLIQNHPHDSICGCSIDEVHREMMPRFAETQQIGKNIASESINNIVGTIDFSKVSPTKQGEYLLVVFNTLNWKRTDICRIIVPCNNLTKYLGQQSYKVKCLDGRELPCHIKSVDGVHTSGLVDWFEKSGFEISFIAEDIPPLGYRTFIIVPSEQNTEQKTQMNDRTVDIVSKSAPIVIASENEAISNLRYSKKLSYSERLLRRCAPRNDIFGQSVDNIQITETENLFIHSVPKEAAAQVALLSPAIKLLAENQFFILGIKQNGTLLIKNKSTGYIYSNMMLFEDSGDCGDEYDFSPTQETPKTSKNAKAKINIAEQNDVFITIKIEVPMRLPIAINAQNRKLRNAKSISYSIISYITLYNKINRIDVVTEVDNTVKDHRLRVLFPTNINEDHCWAEGTFDVVKRTVLSITPAEADLTHPHSRDCYQKSGNTYPQQDFVSVDDSNNGLTIINNGLPEYEVFKDKKGLTIALTLLRCVGWLSRDDLTTRCDDAGPALPTPEAQCLGKHIFKYSIYPHKHNWESANSAAISKFHNVPLQYSFVKPVSASFKQEIETQKIITITKGSNKTINYRELALNILPTHQHGNFSFLQIDHDSVIVSALKKSERDNSIVLRVVNYSLNNNQPIVQFKFAYKIASINLLNLNEEIVEDTENTIAAIKIVEQTPSLFSSIALIKMIPYRIITLGIIMKG